MSSPQTDVENHQAIALRAYYFWQQRGCPVGTPEVDWFRAEEQFNEQLVNGESKPMVVAAAELMGSALGTVAGLVASVADLVCPDPSKSD